MTTTEYHEDIARVLRRFERARIEHGTQPGYEDAILDLREVEEAMRGVPSAIERLAISRARAKE